MTTMQALIRKILALPPEKQREVLRYAEKVDGGPQQTVRSSLFDPAGIAAGLRGDLSFDEFQTNRREMWGSEPGEDLV